MGIDAEELKGLLARKSGRKGEKGEKRRPEKALDRFLRANYRENDLPVQPPASSYSVEMTA